ncbi:MAG: hypothetical protein R3C10_06945 [Pirellulales bacterium]
MFAIAVISALISERYRLRRIERKFFQGRHGISEEEYLRSFAVDTDLRDYFVAGRRTMAELCGRTPEMIHPDDSMRTLMAMQFDNGFIQDLAIGIEKHTQLRIDTRRMPTPGDDSFADYLVTLARMNDLMQTKDSPDG